MHFIMHIKSSCKVKNTERLFASTYVPFASKDKDILEPQLCKHDQNIHIAFDVKMGQKNIYKKSIS